jgi:hypothetical protein
MQVKAGDVYLQRLLYESARDILRGPRARRPQRFIPYNFHHEVSVLEAHHFSTVGPCKLLPHAAPLLTHPKTLYKYSGFEKTRS